MKTIFRSKVMKEDSIGIEYTASPSALSTEYDVFREMMLQNGQIYFFPNPFNPKDARENNVYLEREDTGLELYPDCYGQAQNILDNLGIESVAKRDRLYKRFLNENKVLKDPLNRDAKYLIATQNGEVIDLNTLHTLRNEGKTSESTINEWKRPIINYRNHYITLRTTVKYPENVNLNRGLEALERFLRLVTGVAFFGEAQFRNTFQWILQFLGRLLIGKNVRKEFIVLVGVKDSGKTTFVKFLEHIFGSYSAIISDNIMYASTFSKISKELYSVKDKRLLIYSEGSSPKKVNTQTLKRITGDTSISLNDKTSSFEIGGKIIEDTNYIPRPDEEKDEAFKNRIMIIPFLNNTAFGPATIQSVIENLYAEAENIFALMVNEAVKSMSDVPVVNLGCSDITKNQLDMIRNPIEFFYKNYCERVSSNIRISGKDLLQEYINWVSIAQTVVKAYPYLGSEQSIEVPTPTAFNAKMRKLHPNIVSHSNSGLMYLGIRVAKERIYLPNNIIAFQKDPFYDQKVQYIDNVDRMANTGESFKSMIQNNKDIDKEVGKAAMRAKKYCDEALLSGWYNPPHYSPFPPMYNNFAPTMSPIVPPASAFQKDEHRKPQENQDDEKPNDAEKSIEPPYQVREYPERYFAHSNGKLAMSYTTPVTPFDLPETGSLQPDNFITPFDLDPEEGVANE
jgi:phage/plasmid-associated DNA primase